MKISQRGQVTIPKHLRERFGLNYNVEVEISPAVDGIVVREKRVEKISPEPVALIYRTRVTSDEEARRIASYFDKTDRAADPNHPVNLVYGILDKDALGEGVKLDDYIEEIRGK